MTESRKLRDEARETLSKASQAWSKERAEMAHKLRQEEKLQATETTTLNDKFDSRQRVHEETTKALNAQLSTARRERDGAKERAVVADKLVSETKMKLKEAETTFETKLAAKLECAQECADLKHEVDVLKTRMTDATKEHDVEKEMWKIERDEIVLKLPQVILHS